MSGIKSSIQYMEIENNMVTDKITKISQEVSVLQNERKKTAPELEKLESELPRLSKEIVGLEKKIHKIEDDIFEEFSKKASDYTFFFLSWLFICYPVLWPIVRFGGKTKRQV